MSKRSRSARAAELFSALGDETRLALVERLGDGAPLSISELTDVTQVTRQGVTKHLRVLEGAGLVTHTRRGRQVLYALEGGPVGEARALLDAVSARWDRALGRLAALVDGAEATVAPAMKPARARGAKKRAQRRR